MDLKYLMIIGRHLRVNILLWTSFILKSCRFHMILGTFHYFRTGRYCIQIIIVIVASYGSVVKTLYTNTCRTNILPEVQYGTSKELVHTITFQRDTTSKHCVASMQLDVFFYSFLQIILATYSTY